MAKMSSLIFSSLTISFVLMLVAPPAWGQTDLTSDFTINVTSGEDLTYRGLENVPDNPPGIMTITFVDLPHFPPLAGQGVSIGLLKFGPKTVNTLHNHPRGSELLTVLSGTILVGIVDTSYKLWTSVLNPGDSFVFPIGLMHFQYNMQDEPATAIASFGNPNAGRISWPHGIFNSEPRIDTSFLEIAMDLDAKTVERLLVWPFPTDA